MALHLTMKLTPILIRKQLLASPDSYSYPSCSPEPDSTLIMSFNTTPYPYPNLNPN